MARRKTFIRLEGMDELKKQLAKIDNSANVLLENASRENAETVLATAKQLVPTRTGKLRDSLTVRKESTKQGKYTYQIYTKGESEGGVRYGFAVEYGLKKKEYGARPFMRPALKKNKKNIIDNFNRSIKKALEG